MLREEQNNFLYLLILFIGLFFILIVNRELGWADNGDFSRYMSLYVSKPFNLEVNWPTKPEDYQYRFFNQPMIYWNTHVETNIKYLWSTSTSFFWSIGLVLNNYFYSDKIVNLRYIGLPFFLVHSFFFAYLIYFIKRNPSFINLFLIFLFFTSVKLTLYYNSFYSESLVILTLFVIFTFFYTLIFSKESNSRVFFILIVSFFLIISIFSKRQYIYFYLPTIIFICYIVFFRLKINTKLKWMYFISFFIVLSSFISFSTLSQRISNIDESKASNITSYHALYYGLLQYSTKPEETLEKLNLPVDSVKLIGYSYFIQKDEYKNIIVEKVNFKVFIEAIFIEPKSFFKLILINLNEFGNLDLQLGSTYGEYKKIPKTDLSLITYIIDSANNRIILFIIILLLIIIMFFFKFNLSSEQMLANRFYLLIIFCIIICDVIISTFDGQQEARKHIIIASTASVIVLVHFIMILSNYIYFLVYQDNLNNKITKEY